MNSTKGKFAVLLVSLGTPAAPTAKSIRQFLRAFLSDPRVVEAPRVVWWCVLNVIILPFRPAKIGKIYQQLWAQYGDSPLRLIAGKQTQLLQKMLDDDVGTGQIRVFNCSTYMENRVDTVVASLADQDMERVLVLPLFPQYSATTTGAVYDLLAKTMLQLRNQPDLSIVKSYYSLTDYRKALAASVLEYWGQQDNPDLLLMSFHGIPQAYVDKGDPYLEHCTETAHNLAEDLNLDKKQWQMCFQSNVGKMEWLKPYASELLVTLAKQGIKRIDVVCPSFSSDCIETLYEISEENRFIFESSGGEQLRLIPCLNDRPDHILVMKNIVKQRFGMPNSSEER